MSLEKICWKVKKSKTYADAEALYALDGECSVRTLHACNDPKPSALKKRKGEDLTVGNALDLDLSLIAGEWVFGR